MSGLISTDAALSAISAHPVPEQAEAVPLAAALGRWLAAPVTALIDRPRTDISAMDGYAVRLADVREPGARLTVIGAAPAGRPFTGAVDTGQAVRIFTGGVVPAGADHIVPQEEAERGGDEITCASGYDRSAFIRPAGLDFRAGGTLIPAGVQLGAPELSNAAAANIPELTVRTRPRVGLLANGDELKTPGTDLQPGEEVNSNPAGLSALVTAWGGVPVDLGTAPDRPEAIRERIGAAPEIDIFLPIGGASVGEHDHMPAVFEAAGFVPVFRKIAMRPGKPTWFSTRGDQRALGLPGNPASALVCAHLFLRPLITALPHRFLPMRLAAPLPANGPREAFLRAKVTVDKDGCLSADAGVNQDSALLHPFLTCNALLRRPGNAPAAPAGTPADGLMIGAL